MRLIFSKQLLNYAFGPHHPWQPLRAQIAVENLLRLNVLTSDHVLPPQPASTDDLKLFHDQDYIEFVKRMSQHGTGFLDTGDTPAMPGIFEAACYVVGASTLAVKRAIAEKTAAINLVGGLHHAHATHAAGFCVFNDIVIAILHALKSVSRVLYVDLDAHHGDGVQEAFWTDPRVLHIDVHEDGRFLYPGTGFLHEIGEGEGRGYTVNIPLPPGASGVDLLYVIQEVMRPLADRFQPELVVVQAGADGFLGDLLSHLSYDLQSYLEAIRIVKQVAERYANNRIVLLGGGGYHVYNTALAWVNACLILAGRDPVPELPTQKPPELPPLAPVRSQPSEYVKSLVEQL